MVVHCEPLGDPANGHTAPVEFGHEWTLLFSTCLLYHWRSSPRCSSWKPSFDTGRELSSVFKVPCRTFLNCNTIVPYSKFWFRPLKSWISRLFSPVLHLFWCILRCSVFLIVFHVQWKPSFSPVPVEKAQDTICVRPVPFYFHCVLCDFRFQSLFSVTKVSPKIPRWWSRRSRGQ